MEVFQLEKQMEVFQLEKQKETEKFFHFIKHALRLKESSDFILDTIKLQHNKLSEQFEKQMQLLEKEKTIN